MKKFISILFSVSLLACLIGTCVTQFREIGSDLYKLVKNEDNLISADGINHLFSTIDKTLSDNFVFHSQSIDLYGLMQRTEGKMKVLDSDATKTVLKGSDGKLYFASNALAEDSTDGEQLSKNIQSVISFKEFCDKQQVDFLYVNAPSKYDPSSVVLPEADTPDCFDDSLYFEKSLTDNKVPNLNLMRKLKEKNGNNYSDGFFITDHHWNIGTAFWGFESICDKLNESYDNKIDKELYSKSSYDIHTFEKDFLGSMGTRVGGYYAGKDDIDVISPKFDTSFSVSYNSKTLNKNITTEGDFKTVIHDDSAGYYYITSDNSRVDVKNMGLKNGHKILLIKDSFGVPVSGWLACCSENLIISDLRYEQIVSMYDMVLNNDIDTVIVLYNAEMLKNKSLFEFESVSEGY